MDLSTQSLQKRLKSIVQPFKLNIGPLIKVLVNEEKTRTFITIQVSNSKALEQLVKCCDESLLEFDIHDKFYDPPEFHISFAWILGDQGENIDLENLQKCLEETIEQVDVDSVMCKVGNKLFKLKL